MRKFLLVLTIFIILNTLAVIRGARAAQAATLSLSPATGNYAVNQSFSVDIILDTGSDAVSGATAILTYDTTRLSVVDDDAATAGVQIKAGTIFNQAPLTNTVDTTAGRIQYDSGSLGTTYTGHGAMATIHFKAVAAGTAPVNFVFDANSTTNTSLVAAASGPTNLLTAANNGTYTIGGSGGSTGAPLPPTGVVEDTLMAVSAGAVLLGVGVWLGRKALVTS